MLKAQEGSATPAFCVRIASLPRDIVHVWDVGASRHHDVPAAEYSLTHGDDGVATIHLREGATFSYKFVVDSTHWVHDPVQAHVSDERGGRHNVIEA